MIRHIVLVRYRGHVPSHEREAIVAALAGLRDRVPGMLSIAGGSNVSVEPHVRHGFDDGFVIDFADEAARDAYLTDPEHQAIGARIVAATEGGAGGVVVFDIEL